MPVKREIIFIEFLHIIEVGYPGNRYLFMADIWRPKSLMYSEYLWIPVRFDEEGMPYLTLSGKCNPSDGR